MTSTSAERPRSHPQTQPPFERLVSLDVCRGIAIASMILVNNPGNSEYVYSSLTHADWHGWTPTDFIFPFFLFIVGVALVFLGTCYWLVDIKGYRRWALPFVMFGMNAISVYILAMLGACLLDLYWVVGPAGISMTL